MQLSVGFNLKPVLLFACGNLSRGDDALGPLLLDFVAAHLPFDTVELLTDFQLQIEHALDLQGRSLVLFADASVNSAGNINFRELTAQRDTSYSTHVMSPAAVLSVYQDIFHSPPPPSFLLSIKAERMELGEGLSESAQLHLQSAVTLVTKLLNNQQLDAWRNCAADFLVAS